MAAALFERSAANRFARYCPIIRQIKLGRQFKMNQQTIGRTNQKVQLTDRQVLTLLELQILFNQINVRRRNQQTRQRVLVKMS